MRTNFYELLNGFAKESGCVCTIDASEIQGVLSVEGLDYQLALVEGPGMLLIQAGVGLLPEQNQGEFMRWLLSANNLFKETGGMTFGIDEEQELVTLQLCWTMTGLTSEGFSNLMLNVLNASTQMMGKLYTWEAREKESAPAPALSTSTQNNGLIQDWA